MVFCPARLNSDAEGLSLAVIWPSGWGHSSKQGRVWWTDPFDSRYTNILLDIFVQLNSLPSTSIDLYVVCFATLGGSAVRSSRQEKWKGTFSQHCIAVSQHLSRHDLFEVSVSVSEALPLSSCIYVWPLLAPARHCLKGEKDWKG